MKLKVKPKNMTLNVWPGYTSWVYFRFELPDGTCVAFGNCKTVKLPHLTRLMFGRRDGDNREQ